MNILISLCKNQSLCVYLRACTYIYVCVFRYSEICMCEKPEVGMQSVLSSPVPSLSCGLRQGLSKLGTPFSGLAGR